MSSDLDAGRPASDGARRGGQEVPHLWRGTGYLSVAAGVGWVLFDLRERFSFSNDWGCASLNGYAMSAVDTVAMLGMAVAMLAFFDALWAGERRWLSLAALIGGLGYGLSGTVNLIEHCVVGHMIESSPLGLAPYSLGGLLAIPAGILFALVMTKVRFVPRWCAWSIFVGSIAFPLLGYSGGILIFGVTWVVFGVVLLSEARRSTVAGPFEPLPDTDRSSRS